MKNMSQKTSENSLTKRQLKFAKLKYEDDLNDEEIAVLCGISARTVYEWIKRPEIQREIDRLGEADTKTAVRYFQKNARRAAQATVKLTETHPMKDANGRVMLNKKGQEFQEFIQPGEVVRKASADILQAVEINVKAGEGGVNINITDKKLEISETKNEH